MLEQRRLLSAAAGPAEPSPADAAPPAVEAPMNHPEPSPGGPGYPWVFQDSADAHQANSSPYPQFLWVTTLDATARQDYPSDQAVFRIVRYGGYQPVTFNFSYSGSAAYDVDYTATEYGSVDLDFQENYKDVVITPLIDDDPYEGDETIVVTLAGHPDYFFRDADDEQATIDLLKTGLKISPNPLTLAVPALPVVGPPTGDATAVLAGATGGLYKIATVRPTGNAPAAAGGLFSVDQPSVNQTSTTTLTFTYTGALPPAGTTWTYVVEVQDEYRPQINFFLSIKI